MNVSWKFLGYAAGLALVGAVGACTVTTNNGGGTGDDDDLFDDGGADTSTTSDTGTTDTGTTAPACSEEIYSDGGSRELTLDPAGSGSTTCTTCTEGACCSQLTACFQDPTGDCQELEDCLESCVEADPSDAGGCGNECASLHTAASADLHNAWGDCQTTNCATQCPQ